MARVPGAEAVYEVANLFRQRCLIESKSLLWPDHPAWTEENLDRFWAAFIEDRSTDQTTFMDKFRAQFAGEPKSIQQICADLMVLYSLFPSNDTIGPATKSKYVATVRSWNRLVEPDPDTWVKVDRAFQKGVGGTGSYFVSTMAYQIGFMAAFARELSARGIDARSSNDCKAIADSVAETIPRELEKKISVTPGRNVLLHLLFPDSFERIASDAHKQRIFNQLIRETGLSRETPIDDGILAIRNHLMTQRRVEELDFYDPGIKPLWDPKGGPPPLGPFTELIGVTHHDEAFLREINDLLLQKRQLIFEGPPGSGKTFVAEKFARWFTGQSLDATSPLNERVEIVQFHQSYGYEDFVQGIRPETNDEDQLVYRVRDGIFLTLCERAKANPEKPFVLIIDEINRGNISRIFGELLLLLEYRGMSVRLPYGTEDQATLTIPENLYIIGTMNTADRSLAQIDYALRRRFYFVRFMPVEDGRAEVFGNWLAN